MTELHFLPSARTELRSARRYYRQKDAEVARRFSSEVLKLLQRIVEAPSQFPEHGLLAVPNRLQTLYFTVRKAVLPRTFPFVILYYVSQGAVIVLAVAHDRRRPGYWTHRG